MRVIGISGKAESGKTTFAMMLKEELEAVDKKVLLINYADFLKFIAKQYYNWNGEKDEYGRKLLQRLGTDQGRELVGENFWVDMVINTTIMASKDFDIAIVADCRFPNEFNRWRERGNDMFKIRMERPQHISKLTKEQQNHPSETALDGYTDKNMITICNNEDFDYLRNCAKEIVERFF